MTDINHTYTIQWVGPFHSFEELNEYTNDDDTCASNLFSFYFIVGNKRGKGYPRSKKDYRYFGCHKKDTSICNRVNSYHEHLCQFNDFSLWIGTIANPEHITEENIESIETMFIRTYSDEWTENVKKKKSILDSYCLINLWFKKDETRWIRRKSETVFIDDVMVYDSETQSFLKSNLRKSKG